jgi:hypothetical protein
MSRYLQINDEEEAAELSSNTGWSQFLEWVSTLDKNEFPSLVNFAATGTTNDPQKVSDQVESAVDASEPDEDVSGIAESLQEYLNGETGVASVV